MKNLIFIIFALISTITLTAQNSEKELLQEKKDKKYSIKIQPLSLLASSVKVGFDYAPDQKNAFEIQLGKSFRNQDSQAAYSSEHVQFRYKRFLTDNDQSLSGLYVAPGFDMGRLIGLNTGNKYGYSIFFTDLGLQYGYNLFSFEFFGGLGFQTGHDTGEAAAGCAGCGIGYTPNAINLDALAIRLGMRVGMQF